MLNLRECWQRFAPNPLSRRIRCGQIRELALKIDQFAIQPVVLAIGNSWRPFLVITAIVLGNFLPQPGDLSSCFVGVHWHSGRIWRRSYRAMVLVVFRGTIGPICPMGPMAPPDEFPRR